MVNEYHFIKDKCRKGLLKYLDQAISFVPPIDNPDIIDIGCGSGVPTLFILDKLEGTITGVDPNIKSLRILKTKIEKLRLDGRITLLEKSLFQLKDNSIHYDLVFAEGLLNVIGFKKGFEEIVSLTKENGFIIIHDEYQYQKEKIEILNANNCELLQSFELDEQIWWNDYYKCLEEEIANNSDKDLQELFKADNLEIDGYKKNPTEYRSRYYIIKRN